MEITVPLKSCKAYLIPRGEYVELVFFPSPECVEVMILSNLMVTLLQQSSRGAGMNSEGKTKQEDMHHVHNAGALLVFAPVYLPCEHYDNRNLVQTGS